MFRWTTRRLSAPGNALPYDHWKLSQWRARWSERLRTEGIHEKLILNCDQVWRIVSRGLRPLPPPPPSARGSRCGCCSWRAFRQRLQ
eukprot:2372874-Pyramimonas_sp.AAC.1